MSFENPAFKSKESEAKPETKIEIESGFDVFISNEFRQNPIEYFETKGKKYKTMRS